MISNSNNTKFLPTEFEFIMREGFCHYICNHQSCWTIFQTYLLIFNTFPDEMVTDIDVFHSSMLYRIVRKGDR